MVLLVALMLVPLVTSRMTSFTVEQDITSDRE
jgi:hypothetical protein